MYSISSARVAAARAVISTDRRPGRLPPRPIPTMFRSFRPRTSLIARSEVSPPITGVPVPGANAGSDSRYQRSVHRHVADDLLHRQSRHQRWGSLTLAGIQYRKAIVFVELGRIPICTGVVRIDKPLRSARYRTWCRGRTRSRWRRYRCEHRSAPAPFTKVLGMERSSSRVTRWSPPKERAYVCRPPAALRREPAASRSFRARVAEGVHQIPAVHHVQALAHIEVPRETVAPVQG